jgi:hypothetical protein
MRCFLPKRFGNANWHHWIVYKNETLILNNPY